MATRNPQSCRDRTFVWRQRLGLGPQQLDLFNCPLFTYFGLYVPTASFDLQTFGQVTWPLQVPDSSIDVTRVAYK